MGTRSNQNRGMRCSIRHRLQWSWTLRVKQWKHHSTFVFDLMLILGLYVGGEVLGVWGFKNKGKRLVKRVLYPNIILHVTRIVLCLLKITIYVTSAARPNIWCPWVPTWLVGGWVDRQTQWAPMGTKCRALKYRRSWVFMYLICVNIQGNKKAFTSTWSKGMGFTWMNYTKLLKDRSQTFGSFPKSSVILFPTS